MYSYKLFSSYNLQMSKTPITWLELIKMKLKEEKDKGNSPSIRDVVPEAKKDWAQIKEGKHPKYIQGKAKTHARKKNKGENKKSRKNSMKSFKSSSKSISNSNSNSTPRTPSVDIQELIDELKLCNKCKKKANKLMNKKNMSGGNCGCTGGQHVGGCGGGSCPL